MGKPPGDDGWHNRNRGDINDNHLAMAFAKKDQPAFEALREEIENARLAVPPEPPLYAPGDMVALLSQLNELWRQGAISDDEFHQAKRLLLAK